MRRLDHAVVASIVVLALALAVRSHAGATPELQCRAGKNKAAGKYAACRQDTEARLAATGDAGKYGDTLAACTTKFTATWEKLEAKAAKAGTTCPDGASTSGAFQAVVDDHTNRIAAALGGTRWVDNGDGTVTDNLTHLQWEQKTDDDSVHDKDNTYVLCIDGNADFVCDAGAAATDGTAFTSFLATLNGGTTGVGDCTSADGTTLTGGFAGHCDWRLPTITELQSIVVGTPPCAGGACIDPVFGPTSFTYFSATSVTGYAQPAAWVVGFFSADTDVKYKAQPESVRAVRGAF